MSAPEPEDPGPFVCPGCHAVGDEPCKTGCIDAEIEADRDERRSWEPDDPDFDDDWDEPMPRPEQEPSGRSHSVPPEHDEGDIPC